MKPRYDAIVVGGGVVGAAAAVALSRRGLDVALLERGDAPPPVAAGDDIDPRVYAIAPGTVEFLDALGSWNRVARQRVSPYCGMQVWDTDIETALRFDTQGSDEQQLGFIVEDRLLRHSLWASLSGVDVRTTAEVESFSFDGVARLRVAGDGEMTARLVVGAEGADSGLRAAAGIDTVGWDYPQKSVVCHVGTEKPHQRIAWQRFLSTGPLAFLPLDDGRSSIVWSAQEELAARLMAMDDASFSAELETAFQSQLGRITSVTRRHAFPLRLLHAEQYVCPGLALVGDSAHVVHPLAGQGVNLGLADVAALVEVLASAQASQRDWGMRTLKRYERRRKAENVEMLALTDGLFRLFGSDSGLARGLREAGMFLVDRLDPLKRPLARRAMGL